MKGRRVWARVVLLRWGERDCGGCDGGVEREEVGVRIMEFSYRIVNLDLAAWEACSTSFWSTRFAVWVPSVAKTCFIIWVWLNIIIFRGLSCPNSSWMSSAMSSSCDQPWTFFAVSGCCLFTQHRAVRKSVTFLSVYFVEDIVVTYLGEKPLRHHWPHLTFLLS